MLGGMAICPATAALVERRIPLHRVLPSPQLRGESQSLFQLASRNLDSLCGLAYRAAI